MCCRHHRSYRKKRVPAPTVCLASKRVRAYKSGSLAPSYTRPPSQRPARPLRLDIKESRYIFKQSDTALFQPHPPHQRHARPRPNIQAAQPDRLLRSLPRAPVPHIPTRPCKDIPPVRPLLSYRQIMPTHPTLPEHNPPWTRAAETKSTFEGGQPCERVQRSKAGGCQPRKAILDALSKPNPSQQRHSHKNGRERSDRRSKSRQQNLKDQLPTGVSTPVKAESNRALRHCLDTERIRVEFASQDTGSGNRSAGEWRNGSR